MMKKLLLFLLFSSASFFSQKDSLLNRLSAIENNGKVWYNIDGYSVTSELFREKFDDKGLKKVLRKHSINDNDKKINNSNIDANNLFVSKQKKVLGNIYQTENYYFIENSDKNILVIWFIKVGKTDKAVEEILVNMILENKILSENFVSQDVSSIDFGGRKVDLSKSCYWTDVNSIQCPYFGAMNWSIHKDLNSAKESIDTQLSITKQRKGSQVISEEWIDVEFEDVPTKARKVILDLKGVTSLFAGMSEGKTLTIYYIAENVRNRNISVVMSFWNNDEIDPQTKLPPLLNQFMKLK